MQRGSLDDLVAFVAVGRERSFTKAAAKLGVSQSALSHTIRELEARLGVRLLTRTTRSVSPTEAGERPLRTVGPRFEEIEAELTAIKELRMGNTGAYSVPADHYFVMSDNRHWTDSRELSRMGFIPFENLVGRVDVVFANPSLTSPAAATVHGTAMIARAGAGVER